jgi:hypothetical protein
MPQKPNPDKGKPEIDKPLNWGASHFVTIPTVILDNYIQFINPTQMLIIIHLSRSVDFLKTPEKIGMNDDQLRSCLHDMMAKDLLKVEKQADGSFLFDFSGLTQACIEAEKQKNDQ